jgi:3',5'-cyclic AMP phosphodiesterase CpdA
MKIAHISDLHICANYLKQNITRTETLLKKAKSEAVDHLIVTGDISHTSQPIDYHIFRELLLKYDFYQSDKVTLILGNHDVYGGVHLLEEIFDFPNNCRNLDVPRKINTISQYFKAAFEGVVTAKIDHFFPNIKRVNNTVLVSFDSSAPYSLRTNLTASNGLINEEDMRLVENILQQEEYIGLRKVVLLHHHLSAQARLKNKENPGFIRLFEQQTMRLYGRKKMLNWLQKQNIDLALHGHTHYNFDYSYKDVRIVNGGGSLKDESDGLMKINLINLQSDRIDIETKSIPTSKPKEYEVIPEELIPAFA